MIFSVKIFRKIFSWDFEGFARPERERIVETFSEGFLVEIFSVDFSKSCKKSTLKILLKISEGISIFWVVSI